MTLVNSMSITSSHKVSLEHRSNLVNINPRSPIHAFGRDQEANIIYIIHHHQDRGLLHGVGYDKRFKNKYIHY